MAKQSLSHISFVGGISSNQKSGSAYSCRSSKHLNYGEDVNYVTSYPRTTKVSSTVVEDLTLWMVDGSPYDTNRYSYDLSGNFYRETNVGTWSKERAGATIGNGAAGQGLVVFDDYAYYMTATTIGRYGKLSGTPAFADDFLSDGTTNIDQSNTNTGQTYTMGTGVNEGATHKLSFTPTKDPLKAVILNISAKGTGNWTVEVHDANNVVIGSATIANASLAASGEQTFTFATPLRVVLGNTYHIHVYSTVGDGIVVTGTTNDFSDAYYKTVFGILISANFHMAIEFLGGIAICNQEYLAFWNQATYEPNKLAFKKGYTARSLSFDKQYLVITCFKGTDINDTEDARLYYWDGVQDTFNYIREANVGAANATASFANRLFGIYGLDGRLVYGSQPFQSLWEPKTLARGKRLEVYPGAITTWQNKLVWGYAGNTNDATLLQGVYEFSSRQDNIPEATNHMFTISTGTSTGTTTKIGMCAGFGEALYIGWRDGSTYGVDKVLMSDNPATTMNFESLIFDNGNVQKEKQALSMVITFESLPADITITPKYKIDRGNWVTGSQASELGTVGETRLEIFISDRFYEIEFGFDVANSGTNYPIITGLFFEFDDLMGELNTQ